MKVITSTGMVPVKALERTSRHAAGSIFGMFPAHAIAAVESGQAELYPVPAGVETFEVPGPHPKGQGEPEIVAPPSPDVSVVIPANWDAPPKDGGLQWMQKVKLAEKILGADLAVEPGKKPAQIAEEAIRKELARRAAAETAPQA